MDIRDVLHHIPARAVFDPDRMTKLDCFRSTRLLVGLNAFEAGQSQRVHAHAGADKFYFVVSGKASFVVGSEDFEAATGDLIVAPDGVPHGVALAHERTILLVAIAPAPA